MREYILIMGIIGVMGVLGCSSPYTSPCNVSIIRKKIIVTTRNTQITTPYIYYIPINGIYFRIPDSLDSTFIPTSDNR